MQRHSTINRQLAYRPIMRRYTDKGIVWEYEFMNFKNEQKASNFENFKSFNEFYFCYFYSASYSKSQNDYYVNISI